MTAGETIPDVLASAVERWPHADAVIDGDQRWSFMELADRVRSAAVSLTAAGVEPRSRVAIWAPNSAAWVVAALGVAHAGATLVPINTRSKGPEAADIVSRSGAVLLLTVPSFLGADYRAMLDSTGEQFPALRDTLLIDGLAERSVVAQVDVACTPDDVSHVQFTSGTTGRPKGRCCATARSVARRASGVVAWTWYRVTAISS